MCKRVIVYLTLLIITVGCVTNNKSESLGTSENVNVSTNSKIQGETAGQSSQTGNDIKTPNKSFPELVNEYGQCGVLSTDQLKSLKDLQLEGKRYAKLKPYENQPEGPYDITQINYKEIPLSDGYYSFSFDNGSPIDASEIYVEEYAPTHFISLSTAIGCQANGVAKEIRLK